MSTTAGTPSAPPSVDNLEPKSGPIAGGTTAEPGTGKVKITTTNVGTPLAAWFGVYATSEVTPAPGGGWQAV